MKLERLYDLSVDERKKIAGRASQLPVGQSAKGASPPLVHRGGKPPLPDGTKIALWRKGPPGRELHGSWTAEVTKPKTWWFRTPLVYRLRDNNLLLQLEAEPEATARQTAAKTLTDAIWDNLDTMDFGPGEGDCLITYRDLLRAVEQVIG